MLYRSQIAYRLTQPLALVQEEFEKALEQKLARKCGDQELSTFGFVSPIAPGELERTDTSPTLSLWSQNAVWICARHEAKSIPGSVVREEVTSRVKVIENEQQRKVYKKERDQIKDCVIQEFLPRAFTRTSVTNAYIDLANQLIIVDASSHKKAEDLLSTLREVLGSLPVRPATVKIAPTATMTDWVKQKTSSNGFTVLNSCTLADIQEDGGTVICKSQDLASDEVLQLLEAGKVVTKVSLAFEDKFSFVLDDKLVASRIKYEDLLTDQASKDGGDDKKAVMEASFVLMVETNRLFYSNLFEAFGGEEIPVAI